MYILYSARSLSFNLTSISIYLKKILCVQVTHLAKNRVLNPPIITVLFLCLQCAMCHTDLFQTVPVERDRMFGEQTNIMVLRFTYGSNKVNKGNNKSSYTTNIHLFDQNLEHYYSTKTIFTKNNYVSYCYYFDFSLSLNSDTNFCPDAQFQTSVQNGSVIMFSRNQPHSDTIHGVVP